MGRHERDETRRLCRMIAGLEDLAREASESHTMDAGLPAAVRRFRAAMERLVEIGEMPDTLAPSQDPASYDELAVECASVMAYFGRADEDEEDGRCGGVGEAGRRSDVDLSMVVGLAPFVDGSVLVDLVRDSLQEGQVVDPGLVLGLAPFLPKEELNRLVREHMGRRVTRAAVPVPPMPPVPPVPPMPPVPPVPDVAMASALARVEQVEAALQDVELVIDQEQRHLQGLDAAMDGIAARLREAGIDAATRAALVAEMGKVAEQRAALLERLEAR